MFDIDKWYEILSALAKNPLRTFLTALGVFWGIFMLVIMLGAGNGLRNGVVQGFEGIATNSLFLWTQRTTKPYKGLPAGRGFNMTNEDYLALKRGIAEAKVITPRNQLGGFQGGNNVVRGNESASFSVMGDYPEIQQVESILVTRGRFINPLDMRDRRKVAVIGTRVQEVLFKEDEDPIGESIQINGVYFKVVGVFRTRQSGERGQRDTERIYIPFATFQQAFNYGNRVGWFTMTAKDEYRSSVVAEKAIQILKARHKVHPEDERAFGHFNLEEEFNKIQGLFAAIKAISWFVGILTLVAGVIGVSNIMLVIVKERTKEIGIRRAIGAKPASIVSQIISESVLLTSAAGMAGLTAGILALEAVNSLLASQPADSESMFTNPEVQLQTALIALLVMVVAGALAGFIPARRALAISPVDALRTE